MGLGGTRGLPAWDHCSLGVWTAVEAGILGQVGLEKSELSVEHVEYESLLGYPSRGHLGRGSLSGSFKEREIVVPLGLSSPPRKSFHTLKRPL